MLERKLTAAALVAVAVQAAGGLLWVGAVDARLAEAEARSRGAGELGERLARVEEKLDAVSRQLTRIEAQVEAG